MANKYHSVNVYDLKLEIILEKVVLRQSVFHENICIVFSSLCSIPVKVWEVCCQKQMNTIGLSSVSNLLNNNKLTRHDSFIDSNLPKYPSYPASTPLNSHLQPRRIWVFYSNLNNS